MVAGSGGIVAPDLLSIGASAPVDYIIDSVLYPNKAIKEGYNSTIVTTKSGDQITGIRVRQDDRELVLKDATHDAIVIPLGDIKSQRDGGSIMPSGLTDSLTHGEFVDLIRFLTELGKGKYAAAGGQAVARRWRVVDPPLPEGTAVAPDRLDADSSLNWAPAYSEISGTLPASAFVSKSSKAVVRCQLEATSKGAVNLKINNPAGVQAWLDGIALNLKSQTPLDLAQGIHTLTLAIQNRQHTDGLRLELQDVAGSAAKVQFVGGK
jgi:putative heme-binding domain-containing protein